MDVTSPRTAAELRQLLDAQLELSALLAEMPAGPAMMDRLLALVATTVGCELGAVWRPEGDALACAATWLASPTSSAAPLAEASAGRMFARGEGLPGHVWETGTPTWIPELLWDPRVAAVVGAHRAGLTSAVAVPLVADGVFEGVVEVFSAERREVDDELLQWLTVSGAHVAQHLARHRAHELVATRDRALAAAANGVTIADASKPGFPIVYVNASFEALTGYTAAEMVGKPCSILQSPDTSPAAIEALSDLLRDRRPGRVEVLNQRKDGKPFWNEVHLSPVLDDAGELVQVIGVQHDITARRAAQERAQYLADHDALTGLANRALLRRVLDRTADRASRGAVQVALITIDLDGFKQVNDADGHAAGDRLLTDVATRLRDASRASDLVARQGGDEFAVVVADLPVADATSLALAAAERVRSALAPLRCSIGVSILGRDAADVEALLRHADVAMYRAKRAGGGGIRLYRVSGAEDLAPTFRPDPVSQPEAEALDAVLADRSVVPVYQPIVELDTGDVVAYEALARGPEGSPVARPDRLFAAARAAGRLAELDQLCSANALCGARDAGLAGPRRLFVNVEPEAIGGPTSPELIAAADSVQGRFDVVIEITERALTARPADLLAAVRTIREAGWGIALDDVGADVRSLALMPLLRPDVIKLDLRLVQEQPTTEIAEIVSAVNAERERTGATVLAEGIETEQHVELARAMGATLGQGWLFGRPVPLPTGDAVPAQPARPLGLAVSSAATSLPDDVSPFAVVTRARGDVRRADKRLLLAMSLQLEQQAAALGDTALIVSAFQNAERFTVPTRRRYTLLAADAAFVAALGVGMESEPAPGVRGAALRPEDPLRGEWSVAVLGPHFAAALVAMDLGDEEGGKKEMDRRFDFTLTYDRDLVVEAAAALMRRVEPLAG